MEYLQAIVLGAVQGLTEFLPISSDGHLFIVRTVFDWPDQGLLFDAVLHIGTLAAIIVVLWRELRDLVVGLWQIVARRQLTKTSQQRLAVAVVIASIPAALAGYFFEDLFTDTFRNVLSVGLWFLTTAAFYFLAEHIVRSRGQARAAGKEEPRMLDALMIGLIQMTALLPGVSRSGTTIAMGELVGMSRAAAAKFSFVMAAPIVAGASLLSLAQLMMGDADAAATGAAQIAWGPLVVGTIVAFIVGVLALKVLLSLVKRRGLTVFAYYLAGLGTLVLILHWVGVW